MCYRAIKNILLNFLIYWAVVLWFGFFAIQGFDAHHDGVMLGAAALVAEGKLIFKEVFCQYGPLAVWIQSIPVRLFGAEDLVIKFTTLLFYGGIALLGGRLWRDILGRKYHWIWWLLFLTLCPFYLVPFHPWSSVYALFFMLLGGVLQLKHLENASGKMLFWAGVCAGAAFLCRTPCGPAAFAAGAGTLLFQQYLNREKRNWSYLGWYSAGAFLPVLVLAFYLTWTGAWRDYFMQCFSFIFNFVVRRGGEWSWTQFADSILPLSINDYINSIFALLPIMGIILLFTTVRGVFHKRFDEVRASLPLVCVLLLALVSWHQYFPVPCVRHLYWAAIPAFGIYALVIRKTVESSKPQLVKILICLILAGVWLWCFYFRGTIVVEYMKKLPQRVSAGLPGLRGTLIFPSQKLVLTTFIREWEKLPLEIRKRGVLNHTPDGIYTAMLPHSGFSHPMFVNWKNDVYPDYAEQVQKHIREKRPAVLSTVFEELPGYVIYFSFKHFDTEFHLLTPED